MESTFMQKNHIELSEINEKLRREVMKTMEPHGLKLVTELDDVTEAERAKWLFWNLHENLDSIRQMEPTLIGQVLSTQLTVCDGQSMWTERTGLERRVELNCKWHMMLTYGDHQIEKMFEIGEGWINLFINQEAPSQPSLQKNQKGYLDACNSLFPNQIYLYGWITEDVWQEVKPQLYNSNPACRTDILLLDNYLFPVKKCFDFVNGPAGALGFTNLEFRLFSHPTERRMARRTDPRQRL